MRALIHAGMHKTGSSSIQRTLAAMELDDWYYPPVPGGNHSGMVMAAFAAAPERKPAYIRQGLRAEFLSGLSDR